MKTLTRQAVRRTKVVLIVLIGLLIITAEAAAQGRTRTQTTGSRNTATRAQQQSQTRQTANRSTRATAPQRESSDRGTTSAGVTQRTETRQSATRATRTPTPSGQTATNRPEATRATTQPQTRQTTSRTTTDRAPTVRSNTTTREAPQNQTRQSATRTTRTATPNRQTATDRPATTRATSQPQTRQTTSRSTTDRAPAVRSNTTTRVTPQNQVRQPASRTTVQGRETSTSRTNTTVQSRGRDTQAGTRTTSRETITTNRNRNTSRSETGVTNRNAVQANNRSLAGTGGRYIPPKRRVYIPPAYTLFHRSRPGLNIHLDIRWPWEFRFRRRWAPRYRYRQVVYIEANWGYGHRQSRIDVRTVYRHNVRYASANRAEVDIYIDRIELYEDGRFLGDVYNIPTGMSQITATINRNGRITFNRDVFLVGDPFTGFEMVSTRHYDSFILNAFSVSHGYRAGVLNLRSGRVVEAGRSRFMETSQFAGYVPISLLPEDTSWLFDFGNESYSGYYFGNNETYYYGHEEGQYDPVWDQGYGYDEVYYDRQAAPNGEVLNGGYIQNNEAGRPELEFRMEDRPGEVIQLQQTNERQFRTQEGAEIQLKKDTQLERIG